MANLTASLAQDNYKSTLSQAYNWAVWTIYVKNTPTVTFPAGKKVFLTINPEKSNMQVVRVSARDSALKTITVDSIAVNKWSGTAYTQQSHAVGSKVVISIPYAVWEELDTVTTGKNDTNSNDTATGKFADTTARDAYFTAPVNWNTAYVTSLWLWTDYIGGAWVDRATGSVSNASTTVAGKVEISTQAETEAQTTTWWTGAIVVPTNATINPNNITSASPATWDKISFADVSASNVLRSTTIATMLALWTQLASNAQADAGTDTLTAISPSQLKYSWSTPIAWTDVTVASLTTERSQNGTTYTQKYIWTILRTWTYTVSFWLSRQNGGSGGTAYGRIYKNGVAFGTEQSTTSAYSSFVTKTENLAFTAWDTISLWLKAGVPASDIAYANNFLVTCSQPHFTIA